MGRWVVAHFATGGVFAVLDAVRLRTMVPRLYRPELGNLLMNGFRPAPAIVFYLIYIGGIMWFATAPALGHGRIGAAALNGALLGMLCYATYDLTNHATLRQWSVVVTLVDIAWGTVATGLAAACGAWITLRLIPGGR